MDDFPMGDKYSPFLYDAVMLYAIAINETFEKGIDTRSGVNIAASFRRKLFYGKLHIQINYRRNPTILKRHDPIPPNQKNN